MKIPKYTVLSRPDADSTWFVAFAGNNRKIAEQVYLREVRRGRNAYVAVRPEEPESAS